MKTLLLHTDFSKDGTTHEIRTLKRRIMKKSVLAFSIILLIFTWGGVHNDALAQNITIRGRVTDATTKLPIDYAAVVAKGANLAEMTDADGAYEIRVAPGTTLEYSCLGYISRTQKGECRTSPSKLTQFRLTPSWQSATAPPSEAT